MEKEFLQQIPHNIINKFWIDIYVLYFLTMHIFYLNLRLYIKKKI